jgi:hypothetical protein
MVGILGMHRSGTSCLSGCLEEYGLALGEVSNAAPNNLKGNKENLAFRHINDAVLAMSGGAWDRPPEQLNWDSDLRRRRDVYLAEHASLDLWGVKDPRTLLTLPFWEEADVNLRCVGTFRHPAAVASSLAARRNLQPATPSLELWKAYNLKLLDYVQRYGIPIVSFDLSTVEYRETVKQIAHRLGLENSEHVELEFFEEDYRHYLPKNLIDHDCPEEYLTLYNALSAHAIKPNTLVSEL